MLSQETAAQTSQIQIWPIDRLVFYARNPRKATRRGSHAAASEFGFRSRCAATARLDGHLRLAMAGHRGR
jgi:hypothetical protein